MFRKFPIDELRPGMFIADASELMPNTPFFYTKEGLLQSLEEAESIAGQGYREALVDLSRSDKEWAVLYGETAEAELASVVHQLILSPDAPGPLEPRADLAVELPRAAALYTSALRTARHVMHHFRGTKEVDIKAGSIVVENIIDSVLHNSGALQVVSKLRSHDDYTFTHCVNVSMFAIMLARNLGRSDTELFEAGLAGFFHDLGKMQLPADLLNAPRALTAEEFAVIRRHPQIGWESISKISAIPESVLSATLEHHEHIDGSGYPGAKKGNEISESGRIIAIADVYDALSSRRAYKEPMLPHHALGLMYGMRDKQLHPELTEYFIRCIGIYPPGSVVRLASGEIGVVMQISYAAPLYPTVLVVRDPQGGFVPASPVDLAKKQDLAIIACLKAGEFGVNPALVLREYSRLQTKILHH